MTEQVLDYEGQLDFLDVTSLSAISFNETLKKMSDRPCDRPFVYVVTPNAQHIVMLSRANDALHGAYASAWMRLCDSQVLRAIAWLIYRARLDLVTGSDLTSALLHRVLRPDDRVTIVGGTTEMAGALRQQFGLRHVAQHIPPMRYISSDAEVQRCVQFVLAHPARFTFVVTGAPQSELLALRIAETGAATGIGLCVGSALDFATGRVRRAPAMMRRIGLEWLFRLGLEPRRLVRRYAVESPPVFLLAARYWAALRFGHGKRAVGRGTADAGEVPHG